MAMIVANWPMSFHVGAIVVFRMLAPIRNPRPRLKACPSSSLLSCIAGADLIPRSASLMYIARLFTIPTEITIIAASWQMFTMNVFMVSTAFANVSIILFCP